MDVLYGMNEMNRKGFKREDVQDRFLKQKQTVPRLG